MNATIQLQGKEIKLSAKCKAKGVSFPNDQTSRTIHNRFLISVKCERVKFSFDFYGSHNDYTTGATEMKEADLQNAFECFMMEAISGKTDFEEFCSEFGYDTDSRRAERIYKACKRSAATAERIFSDLYEASNELNQLVNA